MSQNLIVYRDEKHYREKFAEQLDTVLSLFYSEKYPAPAQLYVEAWDICGRNRTERQVRLALDHLKAEFRKDRIVACLRNAREYAHKTEAQDRALTEEQASGGIGAIIADDPALNQVTRAVFAYTRHHLRTRVDLKLGEPGCEEQSRRFNDGMRTDDARWVAEWAEIARIDATHRVKSEATIRRERIEAAHEA